MDAGTVTAPAGSSLAAGPSSVASPGWYGARRVSMTAMPQLVSLFNAVGGGAAALLAVHDAVRFVPDAAPAGAASRCRVARPRHRRGHLHRLADRRGQAAGHRARPADRVPRRAGGQRRLSAVVLVAGAAPGHRPRRALPLLADLAVAALGFGVTMVLPIGGADMPVVISLLNAFTGTAVAMAGFVIGNTVLIIAGALVGASGTILTKLMADAMNRSHRRASWSAGSAPATSDRPASDARPRHGAGDHRPTTRPSSSPTPPRSSSCPATAWPPRRPSTRSTSSPALLESRGVEVSYAIHPVAGRMPGHMNVLLAEANVPYPQLIDLDEINPRVRPYRRRRWSSAPTTSSTRRRAVPATPCPACRSSTSTRPRSVIVIKRSMGHGYAGIDNELYTDPKTGMFFADAKAGLTALTAAVTTLVG